MKFLVFACLLVLAAGSRQPNIQFEPTYGGVAFVDPEELLEAALYQSLSKSGILKVDVDEFRRIPNTYEVDLYTREKLDEGFKSTFEKVLRTELGFSGATVKGPLPNRFYMHYFGDVMHKNTFDVHFEPATFLEEMQSLAKTVAASTRLSLEDSLFD